MRRYKINLTSMQWGLVALDLGRLDERSDSSDALIQLIKLALDHVSDDGEILPWNVEEG